MRPSIAELVRQVVAHKAEREARIARHQAYRAMNPEERRAAKLAEREAQFAERAKRNDST